MLLKIEMKAFWPGAIALKRRVLGFMASALQSSSVPGVRESLFAVLWATCGQLQGMRRREGSVQCPGQPETGMSRRETDTFAYAILPAMAFSLEYLEGMKPFYTLWNTHRALFWGAEISQHKSHWDAVSGAREGRS